MILFGLFLSVLLKVLTYEELLPRSYSLSVFRTVKWERKNNYFTVEIRHSN